MMEIHKSDPQTRTQSGKKSESKQKQSRKKSDSGTSKDREKSRKIPMTVEDLRVLWKEKEAYLRQYCEPVTPSDFYRDMFPEGSFEQAGCYDDRKPNGIILVNPQGPKRRRLTVTDDLKGFTEDMADKSAITSPIGYFGKNRSAANVREIYGMVIDLDDVGMPQLRDVFHQMEIGYIPQTTYIVNSGSGLHLYYLFEDPIPGYPFNQKWLKAMKKELIKIVWNLFTSLSDDPQIQGVVQGYRVIGSLSKLGPGYPVTAYCTGGKRVTPEYLLTFLERDEAAHFEVKQLMIKKTGISLQQAIEKWPEWAEHRNDPEQRRKWTCHPGLYEWWLNEISDPRKVRVGHRYFCIMALAIYAVKCDIDEDRLYNDAFGLVGFMDELTTDETNHFDEDDVISAVEAFQDCYATFPRAEIEIISGITIPPNKRNGRTREEHLKRARAVQNIDYPDGSWINRAGRPLGSGTAQRTITEWRNEHPEGRKADCIRDTGLSKPTVLKWWDNPFVEEKKEKVHPTYRDGHIWAKVPPDLSQLEKLMEAFHSSLDDDSEV